MGDLVKRLHSEVGSFKDMIALHLEAKAEIERLHEALRLAKDDMLRAVDHIDGELDAFEKDTKK